MPSQKPGKPLRSGSGSEVLGPPSSPPPPSLVDQSVPPGGEASRGANVLRRLADLALLQNPGHLSRCGSAWRGLSGTPRGPVVVQRRRRCTAVGGAPRAKGTDMLPQALQRREIQRYMQLHARFSHHRTRCQACRLACGGSDGEACSLILYCQVGRADVCVRSAYAVILPQSWRGSVCAPQHRPGSWYHRFSHRTRCQACTKSTRTCNFPLPPENAAPPASRAARACQQA